MSCGSVSCLDVLALLLPFKGAKAPSVLSAVAGGEAVAGSIRVTAVECLADLALPATYLKPSAGTNGANARDLQRLYEGPINELAAVFVATRVIENVGRSAAALLEARVRVARVRVAQNNLNNLALGMELMRHLLSLLLRMLRHSSENHARLRMSLSRDSPSFVPLAVLPYFRRLLEVTPEDLRRMPPAGRRRFAANVLLGVRALAVLTFKVKTVRAAVCEDHGEQVRRVLELLAGGRPNPELLAALFKLHVNVEGGHGEGWMIPHRSVAKVLLGELERVLSAGGPCLSLYYRCAAWNVDGVPTNKASRAYGLCREAFELEGLEFVGKEEAEEAKANVKAGGRKKRVRKKKNKKEKGEEAEAEEEEEEEEEDEEEKDDSSSVRKELFVDLTRAEDKTETAVPKKSPNHISAAGRKVPSSAANSPATGPPLTPPRSPAVAPGRGGEAKREPPEARTEARERESESLEGGAPEKRGGGRREGGEGGGEAKHRNECYDEDDGSDDGSDDLHFEGEGKEKDEDDYEKEETKGEEESHAASVVAVDFGSLQMDELDGMFLGSLGVGRGPPPHKFCCSLTGEIMREPIRNPHGGRWDEPAWYDRCSLLQLLVDREEEGGASWPGADVRLNEREVLEMKVDERLSEEIKKWQSRANGF